MRRALLIRHDALAPLLVVLLPAAVMAQPPSAAAAFDEGRRLLAAGQVAAACDRFAWSHQQEPALGTLLNLADCRERLGETATAFRLFNDALAWADRNREARRVEAARGRVESLRPRLSMVAVEVEGEAPPARVELFSTGAAPRSVARWSLDVPQSVALDPGRYEVTVESEGFEPARVPFAVTVPGVMKVVVPELRRRATMAAPPVALADERPTAVKPVELAPPPVVAARSSRWLGPTLVGAGAALVVGLGVLLGLALDVVARTGAQQQGGATLTVTRQAYEAAVWQAVLGGVGVAAGLVAVSVGIAVLGRGGEPVAQVAVGGTW